MSPDHATLQQAAEWFAVLADPPVSEAQRRAWSQWLATRPEHAVAWQRVEAISGQFSGLPDSGRQAAGSALRRAGTTRRQVLGMLLLASGGGLLAAAGSGRLPWRAWMASERTATGQIRDTRLADGSQLWLGARTAVDIHYGRGLRRLELFQGEILLETAEDPRPWVVDTPQGRLQSLGTRFGVREGREGSLLSVFAGAVRIVPQDATTPVLVQAGQQVRFRRDGCEPAEPVDQARQAWSRGILLADNRRLGDFIDELADHVPGYLGCDPRVADLRLVGAFPLADVTRIFAALQSSLPVRLNRRLPWWATLEPVDT